MNDSILKMLDQEKTRQEDTLDLIASENYTYPEVFKLVGSELMHKYAEGQPGKRYYPGAKFVDQIESICQKRALRAFGLLGADYGVNVQAHSGSSANLAVINALLKPGDKILSLDLRSGGHLSHGWHTDVKKITLISKIYQVEFYNLDPQTFLIDYEALKKLAQKYQPKLIISGGTAYPRDINYQKISQVAQSVGAYYLADIAHEAGLIAAGALSSPFPYANVVTMTTHKTLRGPRGAVIIAQKALINLINSSVFPGLQGGPHLNTIAGIAYTLKQTKTYNFKHYAKQTIKNAQILAAQLVKKGFKVISGGTDKHLVLLDLRPQKITGQQASDRLEKVGLTANKNTIPFDTATAFNPSGLRLGTQALTVRGMKERQMKQIADLINQVLTNPQANQKQIKLQIKTLCHQYPIKN